MSPIKKPLVTTAYDEICRRIITLEYEPGRQLNEQSLVEDLSIGRTPIREALCNLASDMLVESHPNKGVVVPPITLQNTKGVFVALEILECGVARQAMGNKLTPCLEMMEAANGAMETAREKLDIYALVAANNTFHVSYSRCSENVYLIEALRKVRGEANRLAYLSFANEIATEQSLRDHYKHVIEQHGSIIRYTRERNLQQLQEILLLHIVDFKKRIIEYLAT